MRGRSPLLAAACLAAGCASLRHAPADACGDGARAMSRDTLYLGLGLPGGGQVGDAQWRDFLDREVTPRFPQGLTVVPAGGRWRGADGVVRDEPTRLLVVLHDGDPAARGAVAAIAAAWRHRFEQEAVLREITHACVSM